METLYYFTINSALLLNSTRKLYAKETALPLTIEASILTTSEQQQAHHQQTFMQVISKSAFHIDLKAS